MKTKRHLSSTLPLLVVFLCTMAFPVHAGDWPMWRYDAQRSAATADELPAQLTLRWGRQLAAPSPAWPNEERLQFDASNEPVVMGKTLFVGSAIEGSVTALDTETGVERWKFLAQGPVRFAPVATKGRVYCGSDDGWLHCLDAERGTVLWKVRGAPEDRGDFHHFGNGRLISFWPVRGGPVLADGVVYFSAGIWPSMGVFIVACDAETGRVVWSNRDSHLIEKVRIDHDIEKEAGLSPQGYLAIAGEKLLVPNGRCLPAALDRKSGAVLFFRQGYRNGDCRVSVGDRFAFIGRQGVISLETGLEVGSRVLNFGAGLGTNAGAKDPDFIESPALPYKLFEGCDADSVFEGAVAYGQHEGVFYAYDLGGAAQSVYQRKFLGPNPVNAGKWEAPMRWKFGTESNARNPPRSGVLIKAGPRLYGHTGTLLQALDVPPVGDPKIAWQHQIDAEPSSMIAADGKLLVTAKDGRLFCFGEIGGPAVAAVEARREAVAAPDDMTRRTADILARTGVKEGYALVLGIGSGRLAEELLRQSALRVIAVDADAARARRLRDRLTSAGYYSVRAEVFTGPPLDFGFPPYLASLIVSGDATAAEIAGPAAAARLFRLLRPYGGVACLEIGAEAFAGAGGKVEPSKPFTLLRREGPLEGSAAWTHECGDAARSFVSKDDLVRAPLGVLWYGDGPDHGFRRKKDYNTGVKPEGSGGRVLALLPAEQMLHALDAYTGRLMWKTAVGRTTRYVSMPDAVYVAAGRQCAVHDPVTGKLRTAFDFAGESEGDITVSDIRVTGQTIVIAAVHGKDARPGERPAAADFLVALDRHTGAPLWRRKALDRCSSNAVAMSRGVVFCMDSAASGASTVVALDERTGQEKWRAALPITSAAKPRLEFLRTEDWLAHEDKLGLVLAGKERQTFAYDSSTGRSVWSNSKLYHSPLMLHGDTFIGQNGMIHDTATGEPRSKKPLYTKWACNYAVAGEHLIFVRDNSASYIDIATGRKYLLRNIRSGCSNSHVSADGVLNVLCFSVGCECNYPLQTSFGLIHQPEAGAWLGRADVGN